MLAQTIFELMQNLDLLEELVAAPQLVSELLPHLPLDEQNALISLLQSETWAELFELNEDPGWSGWRRRRPYPYL